VASPRSPCVSYGMTGPGYANQEDPVVSQLWGLMHDRKNLYLNPRAVRGFPLVVSAAFHFNFGFGVTDLYTRYYEPRESYESSS
jgi:hypothetical protein